MLIQRIPGSCGRVAWHCNASYGCGERKLSLQNLS
jgi:hypothetical protein